MSDLISRADAIDAVVSWTVEDRPHEVMPTDLVDRIKALPSADAVPQSEQYKKGFEDAKRAYEIELARSAEAVQGKWIGKNSHTYICGDCGFEQAIYGNINEYNYCPRCGVYKEYVDYGGIFPQKRTPHKGGDEE